jgi:phosphoglycerol transferase MdoB-like AlkP superfamily enzyme
MEDMHRGFGFARSFFDTAYRSTEPVDAWRFVSDSVFLPRTVKVLQEQPSPFFAYLLTSTNHDPYLVPQQERQLNLTSVPDQRLANYLESVRRFDNAFGDFVSALDAAGILDSTVLVIYGDHQGFLNDSDSLARLLGVSPDDRFEMWRNRKHLPLFIRLPGGAHAGERADVGGHLDVAPTVLSLVGISPAAEVMMGRDLTSGGPGMVVFRDGSYVDDRHYFINYFGPIRRARCYELATGRPTSCEPMRERRALAQEQLGVSDRIVTGDLVPDVRAALASAAGAGHHDSSSSRSSRSR